MKEPNNLGIVATDATSYHSRKIDFVKEELLNKDCSTWFADVPEENTTDTADASFYGNRDAHCSYLVNDMRIRLSRLEDHII